MGKINNYDGLLKGRQRRGLPGPPGPPGPGFKKTSDGNYDAEDKKLANLQKCVDEKDATNKKYVDDQFTSVMMTRNVFSKGISMQDGRIEGLPDPVSEADTAKKKYVDDRDEVKTAEMRAFAATKDQKLTQKIADGDKFKSIHTKNMLNLKSGDFSTGAAQLNRFIFGEYRDFTQKYHNSKAHIVCSLQDTMGLISVDIGVLKPGKYGLRVEGIIDPKDDGSRFDIDTRTFTTPDMITRTRYKEKIDPHAVAMDMEIEVTNEVRNYLLGIDIEHVPNKEIALFIFGRRGEGHVDPQIIDNINYYYKIMIPEYKSFMAEYRKKLTGISVSNYHDITSSNPIENLLGDPNDFSHKDSVSHFRSPKVYTSGYFFELDFPCLVAMTAVRIIQRTDSNHGTWMVRCYNEKTGVFDDLISSRGFNWTGKDLLVQLRWLEIVYWRARPVPLNTATESRPMHATFKLNMLRARAHQARACANNDLVPSKSLENLDFDQKYL